MKLLSHGKFGKRIQYSFLISTVIIMLMVVFCVIGVRFAMNENIRGQMALDRIDNSINNFYKAIINQETGQRGYSLTKDESFLQPYYEGEELYTESLLELKRHVDFYPAMKNDIKEVTSLGEKWHDQFIQPLVAMSLKGGQPSTEQLRAEKQAFDEFRQSYFAIIERIDEERSVVREKMKSRVNTIFLTLVVNSIAILLVNLIVNFKVLQSITRPIIQLSDSVKSYAQHQFEKDVPSYRMNDELSVLIKNIDTMRNELSKSIRTLELKANIDGLTGIYNRRFFNEFLKKQWVQMIEQSQPISLIIFDIDYFKKYNDTYGHLAGDNCLKAISSALQQYNENQFNLFARYGGEEFCIILLQRSKKEALTIAEEIRKKVLELKIPHKNSTINKYVTVSIGVATIIPSRDTTPETLISFADKALYTSKEKGRNCVTVYDSTI